MTKSRLNLRLAALEDADVVSRIVCTVSDGVTDALFSGLLPGKSPEEILSLTFSKGVVPYCLDNVVIASVDGRTAGICFAYESKFQTISSVMQAFVPKKRIDSVRSLLTASVPGALWINTLWVDDQWRGQGLAQLLLSCARKRALDLGLDAIALHVFNDNARAVAFYQKEGFKKVQDINYRGEISKKHFMNGLLLVKNLQIEEEGS